MTETLDGLATMNFWSVTTINKLGLGSGEQLIDWNRGVVAAKAIDDERIWKSRLENEGRDSAIKYLKERAWVESAHNKARGSLAHLAFEAFSLGKPVETTDEVRPYFEQFRAWCELHGPRFLMAEAPVYNVGMQYAGTLDGIFELGGKRLLYDLKTTPKDPSARSRPPYAEVALQLCAYSRAQEVGVISEQRYSGRGRDRYYIYDPNEKHEPMPEVDGALCIVVSPFDCFAVPVRIDDEVWRTFQAVVKCARWTARGTTDLFGPPLSPPVVEAVA